MIDRHHLKHLNHIERLNCVYCGYANGLLAYAREIAARTEIYWCPIKHAQSIKDKHRYYHDFVNFGDGENYHKKVKILRQQMTDKTISRNEN